MSNQGQSSAKTPSGAFAECHYYDGGLRAHAITNSGSRPDWAPSYEWVGFRDEISLSGDDRVIEIVKFAHKQGTVSWVGVYESAPDKVFGDRSNHKGIGVWLFNSFPNSPTTLIEDLSKLLVRFQRDQPEKFDKTVKGFIKDYLMDRVAPYTQLPTPLSGLVSAKNQSVSTVIRFIDRTHAEADERVNDLVYRSFFLSIEGDANRLLLLLTSQAVENVKLKQHAQSRIASDVTKALPIAFADQSLTIKRFTKNQAEYKQAIEAQNKKIGMLTSELQQAKSVMSEMDRKYRDLKTSIEENDELQRILLLGDRISALRSDIGGISAGLNDLKRGIIAEVQSEMRSARSTSPSTRVTGVGNSHGKGGREPTNGDAGNEWFWTIILGSLAIIILAGIVYFIYWLAF